MLEQRKLELAGLTDRIKLKSETGGVTPDDIYELIDIQSKIIKDLEENLGKLGLISKGSE